MSKKGAIAYMCISAVFTALAAFVFGALIMSLDNAGSSWSWGTWEIGGFVVAILGIVVGSFSLTKGINEYKDACVAEATVCGNKMPAVPKSAEKTKEKWGAPAMKTTNLVLDECEPDNLNDFFEPGEVSEGLDFFEPGEVSEELEAEIDTALNELPA